MFKITRIYNQNRFRIWTIAIIAIFIIAIVQLFNNAYGNANKNIKIIKEENIIYSNIVDYEKASTSAISNIKIDTNTSSEIQKILENFLIYCCNGQVEEAYGLLTDECKELMYSSKEAFDENYCKKIYEEKRTYSFQLWSTGEHSYVYLVKIYEDMLSTGRDTSKNYLQDYITILKQDGRYMLNISKFIQTRNIDKEIEVQNVKFKVNCSRVYMDYEIYELEIRNNRDKEIILDTLEKDNSTYVQNQDGTNIRALLYEKNQEELMVRPGEVKNIAIKFNNTFIGSNHINTLVFSNIVIDEEKYREDEKDNNASMKIEINVRT